MYCIETSQPERLPVLVALPFTFVLIESIVETNGSIQNYIGPHFDIIDLQQVTISFMDFS
jgi:hypothetical protein